MATPNSNYSGATTTNQSEVDERLKVEVGSKKKKILKAKLKKYGTFR